MPVQTLRQRQAQVGLPQYLSLAQPHGTTRHEQKRPWVRRSGCLLETGSILLDLIAAADGENIHTVSCEMNVVLRMEQTEVLGSA